MIKITALNEVVNIENDDDYVNNFTKEAQEQVALNEYNRALELLIKNRKEEALSVLKGLLNSKIVDDVEKPHLCDGRSRPMLSLKYSCYKNVASIQTDLGNYDEAIYNYWEAVNLDDSDVMLWYRIGVTAIKIINLEVACLAFKQGLKRNHNHWPCLDNIITVLYAVPDYINCLLYISIALEKDSTYTKGLAFREQILNDVPSLQNWYKIHHNNYMLDSLIDVNYDYKDGKLLIDEANELKNKWIQASKCNMIKKPLINLLLRRSLVQHSWVELGKSLINMYKYIVNKNLNFSNPITLTTSEQTDLICTENVKFKTFDLCQIKKDSFESNSGFLPDKMVDISKNNNDFDLEHGIEMLDSSKLEDKNKSHISDTRTIEDSKKILKLKNVFNVCHDVEDKNFISSEKQDKKNLNETENINTLSEEPEKFNCKFNNKSFETDESNSKFCSKEKNQKVKKRRRSSLCFLTQWAWSSSNTKRSSRARTSSRKDYERDGILLEETLKQIFPATLLPDYARFTREEVSKNDDSMDTMDLYYLMTSKETNFADDSKSIESSKPTSPVNDDQLKYFGLEQESFDVNVFIANHNNKSNIIITVTKFIEFLCNKWNCKWPNELPGLYIQLYLCMREHIPHYSLLTQNIPDGSLELHAEAALLFCELYIDQWLTTKPYILSMSSLDKLGSGIPADELGYIIFHSTQNHLSNDENVYFLLRSLWLKANVFLYQGDVEISLRTLELLLYHIKQLEENICKLSVTLINCKFNSIISIKTVQTVLKSIERSRKFCNIKYLHQGGKYQELSDILKDTFNFSKQTNQFILCKEVTIDRVEHLQILLDSLWQLQQYEDCFVWAEACLHESWQNYLQIINSVITDNDRSKWIESIVYSLDKLDSCIEEVSIFVVKFLPEHRRSRFVQNLVHIVCHQLDVLDNIPNIPIETILPWILLHYILQYEEDKQRAKSVSSIKCKSYSSTHSGSDEDEEDIPASIQILFKAHEFLGRHGCCCINEGKLLLFILKLIIPKLHFPLYFSIKKKLKEPLEQIIFCLYGHPGKFNNGNRSKSKIFDDHVKSHMALTWEVCELLFDFYKPGKLPNFESKRIDSINAETVNLFKKMYTMIPLDSDPAAIEKEMDAYLHGDVKDLPRVKNPLQSQISYIYYLIADHYFKSSTQWDHAMKYYKLDLCLHPNEFNSWAGLAMSASTTMETWLNNFHPDICTNVEETTIDDNTDIGINDDTQDEELIFEKMVQMPMQDDTQHVDEEENEETEEEEEEEEEEEHASQIHTDAPHTKKRKVPIQ